MYSSKDYEKLWQKYQTEGIAKNMTLQMFCSMNNVPYNSFEKYLKTRRNMSDIHPITVTDLPEDEMRDQDPGEKTAEAPAAPSKEKSSDRESQTRILISIRMTNGMQISQGNLNYRGLRQPLLFMVWKDLVALLECPVIDVLQIRSDILADAI